WALQGAGCGAATLNLATLRVRHRTFYTRVGLLLSERPDAHSTLRLNVLNQAGKVIRTRNLITRYGYGTQPISISLAGGSILQIVWLGDAVVYAMTLS